MGGVSANQALASAVIERLLAAGVRTFCVCPGGRNAPFVEVLDTLPAGSVEVLGFFDERSAGFFALGRARRDGLPVAVVTTSGTAAAELLPPMVEAYLLRGAARCRDRRPAARIPAVGIAAGDRAGRVVWPLRRVVGGPRGPLRAVRSFDTCRARARECLLRGAVARWLAGRRWTGGEERRPTPRPAVRGVVAPPADDAWAEAAKFAAGVGRPLVIVGGLQHEDDSRAALEMCQALGAPVAAEASSGIRSALGSLLLRACDASVHRGFETQAFDSVVRIGDVPSFRVWRDLDLSLTQPVLSISRKPWRGLTRGLHVQVPAGERLVGPGLFEAAERKGSQSLFNWDRRLAEATDRVLAAQPQSEPALFRRLSETIPAGSFVYLGNSLPIREWNQFATFEDRGFSIGENRGANGIDGQVTSFLGWARRDVENWAIVGDLTALYDLSSLWALRHLDGLRLRVVVINNGGGRIFKRMFRNERFQNRHATGFEAWASMWGAEYHPGIPGRPLGPAAVIELRPDEAQTDALWAALADETRR